MNKWRDGLLLVGALFGLAQVVGAVASPDDLAAYWDPSLSALYPTGWGSISGYIYPPPLAVGLALLHGLGWSAVVVGWAVLSFWALWIMAGRWAWVFVLTAVGYLLGVGLLEIPARSFVGYIAMGNVQILLGATVVVGLRWPVAWAVPLLTKVGPGVGVLWFAFRREWHSLAVAVGATAFIAALSFVLAPDTWRQWIVFMSSNRLEDSLVPLVPIAFPVRLAMSIGLLWWAAPRGHFWAVPIAAGWAMPALYVNSFWAIWIGVIATYKMGPRVQPVRMTPREATPREALQRC